MSEEKRKITVLLTPAEARKLLRMGRNQFYDRIKRREITVIRRGRKYLVPESEIERFIQQEIIPAKRNFFKPTNRKLRT